VQMVARPSEKRPGRVQIRRDMLTFSAVIRTAAARERAGVSGHTPIGDGDRA
jgi:hypothetical protein